MMRTHTHHIATAPILSLLFLVSSFVNPSICAASSEKPLEPCTIRSPVSKSIFNLNSISKHPPTKEDLEKHKDDPDWVVKSWHARGHDYYGANFTINFCAPVVEELKDVDGVDKSLWGNVSAYYEMGGRTYSIGQTNTEPVFRGRKLVLNYTDGSPCPNPWSSTNKRKQRSKNLRRQLAPPTEHELLVHKAEDLGAPGSSGDSFENNSHGSEDELDAEDSSDDEPVRRKSTIFSMFCEHDPLAAKAAVSFVGTMDNCTYFFEVRSLAACAGVETSDQGLGPGTVFGFIALVAVAVYAVGGCVYQRNVMHQRGWRQLPNYNLWSGIGSFIVDCFFIATSSCTRCFPRRRGYSRVSGNGGYGRGGRHNGHNEDENRLIDQLDEEWDD